MVGLLVCSIDAWIRGLSGEQGAGYNVGMAGLRCNAVHNDHYHNMILHRYILRSRIADDCGVCTYLSFARLTPSLACPGSLGSIHLEFSVDLI